MKKYYNRSFLETAIVSSDTDWSFYSKYFFRKCHELIIFKKKTISLNEPFSVRFPLKTILWKSIHILWNVDSKWHRVQNTKSQEIWAAVPTFQSKIYSACCCLLHQPPPVHLQVQNRTYTLKLSTSSDKTTGLFQNFVIIAFHHVKLTLKHNQNINILIDKYKR